MGRQPNTSPQTRTVVLALADQPSAWRHGYDLGKATGLSSGTLYPLLMRLHDQGLLEAEWRPSEARGRPPRHAYRLTGSGLALAGSLRAAHAEPWEDKPALPQGAS